MVVGERSGGRLYVCDLIYIAFNNIVKFTALRPEYNFECIEHDFWGKCSNEFPLL